MTDEGLSAALPADVSKRVAALLAAHDPNTTDPVEFLGHQYDAGLAWVHFPTGCGGLGLEPDLHRIVTETLKAAGGPDAFMRNPLGNGMGAPTLVAMGSRDQQDRYLRKLFTGEEVWCQLFSEPGSGSDMASASTRAVRDGDEWLVNGQKVWTTMGHVAHRGMLVARTDPEQPKHKGLTYFIADMHAPGVDVRPLRQMTGDAEFNETYLTDVRIPDADRVGGVGMGWNVSLATLMNERVMLGGRVPERGSGVIADLVATWNDKAEKSPADRDRVTRLWITAEVNRLTNLRASQKAQSGTPGPEGSIGKLAMARLNKAVYEAVIDLYGAEGMLYGDYTMTRPVLDERRGDRPYQFLRARANSIEGGTSEIMANILAERVLGLPGDVRVDKELPWSKVPRS